MAAKPKFPRWSVLLHKKSEAQYHVLAVPDSRYRLEATNEPFYTYVLLSEPGGTIWLRTQSEMEDGRFVLTTDYE